MKGTGKGRNHAQNDVVHHNTDTAYPTLPTLADLGMVPKRAEQAGTARISRAVRSLSAACLSCPRTSTLGLAHARLVAMEARDFIVLSILVRSDTRWEGLTESLL